MKKKTLITISAIVAAMAVVVFTPRKITMIDHINQTKKTEYQFMFEVNALETLNNEHYDFDGWLNHNKVVDSVAFPLVNEEYYAIWAPKTYSIDYNTEEDVMIVNPINEYQYDEINEIILPEAVKDHYVFKGWKLNDEVIFSLPASFDQDITLVPVFEAESYNIAYDLNNGVLTNYIDSYTYGTKPELSSPTKTGYSFTGWYEDEKCTTPFEFTESTYGDIKLYAGWSKQVTKQTKVQVTQQTNNVSTVTTSESSNSYAGNSLTIGSYSIALEWGCNQSSVDAANKGAIFDYYGKTTIGDHRHQGFNVIENISIGSTATLVLDGQSQTLTLTSRYSGYNDGFKLYTSDWTEVSTMSDGWLVMYTCAAGSSGYNITITFWN